MIEECDVANLCEANIIDKIHELVWKGVTDVYGVRNGLKKSILENDYTGIAYNLFEG